MSSGGKVDSAEDYWLEGGVEAVTMGAEDGFLQEVDRVIDLPGTDESWLVWWRRISEAPVLELHMVVGSRRGTTGLVKNV
ncbi:hypothetical protein GCM10009789_43540 [Kribbella sancticallisti]|uniref:Uncharacterized protein n=1 Tax=Kribbella sancticallisti TaxID=460087 RepID=A0ABN2DVE8_9ACTN